MEDLFKLNKIIEHLQNVYDFEMIPCSIPRNHFQYIKRYFYIFIYNKISKSLFYFLRDKVSPIKYLEERPSKEIWFRYHGETGHIEIEIKRIPAEVAIYTTDIKGIFKPGSDNFKVKIYPQLYDIEHRAFPINLWTGIESIDSHFSDFPILRKNLRNYKLKKLIND